MTENQADSMTMPRAFSASEAAVLKRRRIDEPVAATYPDHLSVSGIAVLVDAGVDAHELDAADPLLNAAAILAFRSGGWALDDTDYDTRFLDPAFLAAEGVPASVANTYPGHLGEIDVARFHAAGIAPAMVAGYPADWDSVDIARLVADGVSADDAAAWRVVPGLPVGAIARCAASGAEPGQVARFVEIVGPSVRADPATLVSMALDGDRLADPERFRRDLLSVAIRSVDASDAIHEHKARVVASLTNVLEQGGTLSTTIPDSWNRRRTLHVGPADGTRAVLSVSPDQPLLFSDGEIDLDAGLRQVDEYSAALGS